MSCFVEHGPSYVITCVGCGLTVALGQSCGRQVPLRRRASLPQPVFSSNVVVVGEGLNRNFSVWPIAHWPVADVRAPADCGAFRGVLSGTGHVMRIRPRDVRRVTEGQRRDRIGASAC